MKSTKAEVLKRVEEVFKLRLGGAEYADVVQYASAAEQNWGVSERQIRNYIAAADKLMKERFDSRAEHLLARHLLQRRLLYAHALGAGDFSTALRILDSEAKLEGLFPAEKHEHTGKGGGKVELRVIEEVIHRPAPVALNVIEGVITSGSRGNGTLPNDPPAPGATGLPPQ
jgi:hypothetical protein